MLAKEYAKACFEVVTSKEEFLSEYQEFLTGLRENKEYYKIMASTNLTKETKKELLAKLVSGTLLNFFKVLIDNNRFVLVEDVYQEFKNLVDEEANIMRVKVLSVKSLSDDNLALISNHLAKKFGKKIILTNFVDSSLIDGIKLMYQDKLIDDTILNNLIRMKNTLKEAS